MSKTKQQNKTDLQSQKFLFLQSNKAKTLSIVIVTMSISVKQMKAFPKEKLLVLFILKSLF